MENHLISQLKLTDRVNICSNKQYDLKTSCKNCSWDSGLALAKYSETGTETQRIFHLTGCEAVARLV